MYRHSNSGQNQNTRIANESFENVTKFRYLGTTLTNQNDIHDEKFRKCFLSFSPKSFVIPSHIKKNLKIKIYKTVILPVVLYGYETWSLTLREEHRLRVFDKRVLRRIFAPKREEDGSWRNLHNNELHSPYSSPNIVRVIKSRRMRWAGHVARMREGRGVDRVWLGGPKMRRLGKPRRRREDNIKMDLT
jgi:hypothetical protein